MEKSLNYHKYRALVLEDRGRYKKYLKIMTNSYQIIEKYNSTDPLHSMKYKKYKTHNNLITKKKW